MLTDKLTPWRIAQAVRLAFSPLTIALEAQRAFILTLGSR